MSTPPQPVTAPSAADIVTLRIHAMSLRGQTILADIALMEASLAALESPELAEFAAASESAAHELRAKIANHRTLYALTRASVAEYQARLRQLTYGRN